MPPLVTESPGESSPGGATKTIVLQTSQLANDDPPYKHGESTSKDPPSHLAVVSQMCFRRHLPKAQQKLIPAEQATTNPEHVSASKPVSMPNITPAKRAIQIDHTTAASPEPSQKRPITSSFYIKPPPLVHPKSIYEGYVPSLPRQRERVVLLDFQSKEISPDEPNEYTYYLLEDFRAYRTQQATRLPLEMVGFNNLNVARSSETYAVDGILVSGDGASRAYVEGMLMDIVSVDHSEDDCEPTVWVQSIGARQVNSNIWYVLGKPSDEYERYHTPFKWMAAFGRYVVSYLNHLLVDELVKDVDLQMFREDFAARASSKFGNGTYFPQWLAQYQEGRHRGRTDFRSAVVAHRDWLWNQVYGMSDDRSKIRSITLWQEILYLNAITPAHPPEKSLSETIVTPYVYGCFHKLFPTQLKVVIPPGHSSLTDNDSPVDESAAENGSITTSMRLDTTTLEATSTTTDNIKTSTQTSIQTVSVSTTVAANTKSIPDSAPSAIKDLVARTRASNFKYDNPAVGDVVAVPEDEDTKWLSKGQGVWFGYVTHVDPESKSGKRKLYVNWLFTPADTILSLGDYPHKNELFFSDHCNCDGDPLYDSDIVGLINVDFFGNPNTGMDCFIRQQYLSDGDKSGSFITLRKQDLESRCRCYGFPSVPYCKVREKYGVGDTVLVSINEVMEPAVIHQFHDEDWKVTIRQLKRRNIEQPNTRANELIYTHTFTCISPESVIRPCHIQIFLSDTELPAPYDRNGAGFCFFIIKEEVDGKLMIMRDVPPEELRRGYLLEDIKDKPPLKGLDLFCGGGNFGRGLEEGGAVEMKWAVDIESAPLHSYRANMQNRGDTALYLGSINNYLKDAIEGRYSDKVAQPGEVEFISAGSPCQGFSLANGDRNNARSLQNCSLVSSLATAIDIYRPKYALLENVQQLAKTRQLGSRPEKYNVCATLLCTIVGMGYQCQNFILDSWSYGNAQSRTRVFLAASAPGVGLLERPSRTHSHYVERGAALYQAPNGETFGKREMDELTPFRFRSSGEDFGYLPSIHDDHVNVCIPFPDHRSPRQEASTTRMILTHVPRFPERQGWVHAVVSGKLHPTLAAYDIEKEKNRKLCNRSWSRISENSVCRTITTSLAPACIFTGQWVHYKEPRLLTVQEARIAQGFPDHEVLVGGAAQQFKVVGNSVARGVSLAMGLALRQAYFGSEH